jgi:hypothetical protein
MMRAIPELPPGLWPALEAMAPSFEGFVALARVHSLLPIAANDPSLAPHLREASRKAWEADCVAQDAHSDAVDAHVTRIQSLLPAEDVLYVKGVVFRRQLYPDRTLRAMHDIDVVIRAGRFAPIARQLRDLGYRERARRYFHADGWALPVELIPRFAAPTRHAIDHEEVFRERVAGPDGAPQLSPAHALATYGMLAATQMHISLRKILDLWLLSREESVLAEAAEVARRWKMRRAFHAAMSHVARTLRDSGGAWRTRITGASLTPGERRLVEQSIVPFRTWPPAHPVRTRLQRLALLDSHAMRIRYLAARLAGG